MARIGLIGENSVEYIDKLLDIWNNGDCAVLIDWRIPYLTAIEMMKEADVSVCYLENTKYDIQESSSEINFITYQRKSNSAKLLPSEIYDKFEENYSQNEAIVLYSSGTTGKEKGIILSHYAINTNADAIIDYMRPTDDDCIYIAKVLSHSSTLTGELLVALKTRMRLVIAPTIVPPRFVFKGIEKFEVSIICLNPTLLQKYVNEYDSAKYSLQTLKTIYVSGSILKDNVYTAAHNSFKNIAIYNVYGLTEAGPRVTAQKSNWCKSNSVGKPISGVEIQIVDDAGKPVKQGERGIIHVYIQSRFDGYVVGMSRNTSLYEDWLNSGDIGFFDENGELHIVGRVDDLIIINSHKIYPSEIEQQILELTSVSECVVVKVEYNDDEFICCLYTGEQNMDDNIKQRLSPVFIPYEIPRMFLKTDKIPRVINGKISKREVKEFMVKSFKKEMD